MARIRSVHPGLWTDEAFVSCSPLARLLFIGLWNEADDQGVFEWKPTMLKMRLLPVDNVNVADLLEELQEVDAVRLFENDGRSYGAIRNFRKFQRPKSPNATHPLPPNFRKYVGLSGANGEIDGDDPDPLPPNGEIAPQMEDGGGRREDGGKKEGSADADSSPGGDPSDCADGQSDGRTAEGNEVREAFDDYNATAQRLGLPIARKLTDERRKRIRARLRAAGGLAGFHEALGRIEASEFLTGRTDHGFLADLDFVCQAKSFQRLIEGYYDAKGQGRSTRSQRELNGIDEGFDADEQGQRSDEGRLEGNVLSLSKSGARWA